MTKWRPHGWINPHQGVSISTGSFRHRQSESKEEQAYEAGADAMLLALREDGALAKAGQEYYLVLDIPAYKTKGRRYLIVPRVKGTLVFIPDEEKPVQREYGEG